MAKVTVEQLLELARQIEVGRIGREELQGLLDIPCNVSAPITATAHIEALHRAAEKSPIARRDRGAWMADKDGNVAMTFRVAALPRRKKEYTEVTVREVLASQGLRLPTVEEFLVCWASSSKAGWVGNSLTPCEDGACISSHESEHSVRYLTIPAEPEEPTS